MSFLTERMSPVRFQEIENTAERVVSDQVIDAYHPLARTAAFLLLENKFYSKRDQGYRFAFTADINGAPTKIQIDGRNTEKADILSLWMGPADGSTVGLLTIFANGNARSFMSWDGDMSLEESNTSEIRISYPDADIGRQIENAFVFGKEHPIVQASLLSLATQSS